MDFTYVGRGRVRVVRADSTVVTPGDWWEDVLANWLDAPAEAIRAAVSQDPDMAAGD